MAGEKPNDANVLQTRLHQFIRQQESTILEQRHAKLKTSSTCYNGGNNKEDVELSVDIHYKEQAQPYLKRRIIRGSFSFSTPYYRSRPASNRH